MSAAAKQLALNSPGTSPTPEFLGLHTSSLTQSPDLPSFPESTYNGDINKPTPQKSEESELIYAKRLQPGQAHMSECHQDILSLEITVLFSRVRLSDSWS